LGATTPLSDWVGRSQRHDDVATAGPASILAATLDRDDAAYREGDALPPAWHWLYFHEAVKLADTGVDGHPATGSFLPPVPLPRRMWAGNRMTFTRPLHVGERISRHSTVTRVDEKSGNSGALCFVTVRHEILGEQGLATVEEHDIVYREAPRPGAAMPVAPAPPAGSEFSRTVTPTPVLLFRFSALTMNSHRIHYDREFCVTHEGYPGLVFHGPLTMVLLLDLFRRQRPQTALTGVTVRATSPLYDDGDIRLEGSLGPGHGELWAVGPRGGMAMQASARF
jgi:3-methylfumaryl-CoA hydratase